MHSVPLKVGSDAARIPVTATGSWSRQMVSNSATSWFCSIPSRCQTSSPRRYELPASVGVPHLTPVNPFLGPTKRSCSIDIERVKRPMALMEDLDFVDSSGLDKRPMRLRRLGSDSSQIHRCKKMDFRHAWEHGRAPDDACAAPRGRQSGRHLRTFGSPAGLPRVLVGLRPSCGTIDPRGG